MVPTATMDGELITHLDNEEFSIVSIGDGAIVFILKVRKFTNETLMRLILRPKEYVSYVSMRSLRKNVSL